MSMRLLRLRLGRALSDRRALACCLVIVCGPVLWLSQPRAEDGRAPRLQGSSLEAVTPSGAGSGAGDAQAQDDGQGAHGEGEEGGGGGLEEAAPAASAEAQTCCGPVNVISVVTGRGALGSELQRLGLTGTGVELGVQQGIFSKGLLKGWQQADLYVQVDLWEQQANYVDIANKPNHVQLRFMNESLTNGNEAVAAGWAKALQQCRGFTTTCVSRFEDESLDFIYVDARHDRKGVLEDIQTYWPKLKVGGVMAGHDYLEQYEVEGQDWSLNMDGTRDETKRVVKGAVDDFFSGVPGISHPDVVRCPRQVTVTFERTLNSWMVRKDAMLPAGSPSCCAPSATTWPLRNSSGLGHELRRVGLQGVALELGAGQGEFTKELISGWQEVDMYVQVDPGYAGADGEALKAAAAAAGASMVERGYAKAIRQCADGPTACGAEFGLGTLSFVYRHSMGTDQQGLVEQLAAFWPKLAKGGVMAGDEPKAPKWLAWTVLKFFNGSLSESTPDLVRCPRQVMLTYRTGGQSWIVRK